MLLFASVALVSFALGLMLGFSLGYMIGRDSRKQ
jgi:hypothetical protein